MIGKDVFANNSRKITDEIYNVKEQLELLAQSQNRINNNENSSYVKSLQSQTDMYKKMMSDYNCELDNIQNDRHQIKRLHIFLISVITVKICILFYIMFVLKKYVEISILNGGLTLGFLYFVFASLILIFFSFYKQKYIFLLPGMLLAVIAVNIMAKNTTVSILSTKPLIFILFIWLFLILSILLNYIFIRKKTYKIQTEQQKRLKLLFDKRNSIKQIKKLFNDKNIILSKITEEFISLENLNNLNDYIQCCKTLVDNIIILKNYSKSDYGSIVFDSDDLELIDKLSEKLLCRKEQVLKKVLISHYKIIYEAVKAKQLNHINVIYTTAKNFKDMLNNNEIFDESTELLSETIIEKLDLIIDFISRYKNVYDTNVKYNIDEMDGHDFERYCANLLIGYGFVNVDVTKGSGDQGVDIIGWYGGYKYAIQCKRYSHKLGNTPIQEVSAGKNYYGCQVGLVITNNYFTEGAIALAKANNVQLWNRDKLMSLIYFTDNQWDKLLEKIKLDISEE